GFAPRGKEHVLRELLGSLPGPEQPLAHGENGAGEAGIEGSDGRVVTGEQSFHQLLLLRGEQRSVVVHEGSFRYTGRTFGVAFSGQPIAVHDSMVARAER